MALVVRTMHVHFVQVERGAGGNPLVIYLWLARTVCGDTESDAPMVRWCVRTRV